MDYLFTDRNRTRALEAGKGIHREVTGHMREL